MRSLEVRLRCTPEDEMRAGTIAEDGARILCESHAKGQRLASGTLVPPYGYRHDLVNFAARADGADIGTVEEAFGAWCSTEREAVMHLA